MLGTPHCRGHDAGHAIAVAIYWYERGGPAHRPWRSTRSGPARLHASRSGSYCPAVLSAWVKPAESAMAKSSSKHHIARACRGRKWPSMRDISRHGGQLLKLAADVRSTCGIRWRPKPRHVTGNDAMMDPRGPRVSVCRLFRSVQSLAGGYDRRRDEHDPRDMRPDSFSRGRGPSPPRAASSTS